MSFLERIEEANRTTAVRYRPLRFGGQCVGAVNDVFADALEPWRECFEVTARAVEFASPLRAPGATDERTSAVAEIADTLRRDGVITGWRDELFPVSPRWRDSPLFLLERAAVTHFGVRTWSVHVNGFVRAAHGLKVWVARRAKTKPTYPGELDQVVAGGQPHGLELLENVVKECAEEAGIPAALAARARPAGAIRYERDERRGRKRDTVFVFDLELPGDFVPVNQDGEVERFELWPVEQLIEVTRDTASFKFNCALVNIDFLVRHGFIAADHPDYEDIVTGLIR